MSTPLRFHIQQAGTAADIAAARRLFQAYAEGLPIDLGYQDFAGEVAGLPGKYAPPAGALLLAYGSDGAPIGCVAVRPLTPAGRCEMKRLFVCPEGRGLGLGKALVEQAIRIARAAGYRNMVLDTLDTMQTAQALYRSAGFTEIDAYYKTHVAGTVFLGLALMPEQIRAAGQGEWDHTHCLPS